MVTIRLSRGGAKKKPFYHLVATDSRKRRGSGYIERLGYFNPMATGQEIKLHVNKERVDYWISVGAQTSERVAKLLKEASSLLLNLEKNFQVKHFPIQVTTTHLYQIILIKLIVLNFQRKKLLAQK